MFRNLVPEEPGLFVKGLPERLLVGPDRPEQEDGFPVGFRCHPVPFIELEVAAFAERMDLFLGLFPDGLRRLPLQFLPGERLFPGEALLFQPESAFAEEIDHRPDIGFRDAGQAGEFLQGNLHQEGDGIDLMGQEDVHGMPGQVRVDELPSQERVLPDGGLDGGIDQEPEPCPVRIGFPEPIVRLPQLRIGMRSLVQPDLLGQPGVDGMVGRHRQLPRFIFSYLYPSRPSSMAAPILNITSTVTRKNW